MRKYYILFLVLTLLLFSACAKQNSVSNSADPSKYKSAESYLKALDLTIEKKLPNEEFVMPTPGPRLALLEVFAKDINADVRSYIGKTIVINNYLIKNHPLQKKLGSDVELIASIWTFDDKIIGGNIQAKLKNSLSYVNEGYSLRSRSLKDMTGMEFNDWFMQWKDSAYAEKK